MKPSAVGTSATVTKSPAALNYSGTGEVDASEAVVPFNVLETRTSDLLAALSWIHHADPLSALQNLLKELTGRQQIVLAPSGQCAIAQILSLLPQREVVMPAFMCYQVKQAIEAVNKRIIYVDQATNNVNATAAEYAKVAKPGRILLAVHMYGIPTDIDAICELAKSRDCITIEDAVPGFGGMYKGQPLGTFADFGVFSFQQSKRIPAFRGGVIVVNNDRILDPVKINAHRVIQTKRVLPIDGILAALIQNIATSPWIYKNLTFPLLGVRQTYSRLVAALRKTEVRRINPNGQVPSVPTTAHYTRDFHPYQAELTSRMLHRFGIIRQRIAQQVTIYENILRDSSIQTFLSPQCDRGALMRFPIAFPKKDRAAITGRALNRGLYFKPVWPRPLPEASEYSKFPNALWASRNLLLLPLYSNLTPRAAELLACSAIEINQQTPSI